jgi:hypothetical protein
VTVNASVRARYLLTAGATRVDSVFIDQNAGSGAWVTLMSRPLPADTEVVVTLTDAMNPVVAGKVLRADALRFQWLRFSSTSAGESGGPVPSATALMQNYPNPFNPSSDIRYQISAYGHVRISVFDLLGREVALLVDEQKPPGTYSVRFTASGLSSGVYFYRMQAGNFAEVKRLMFLR